MIEICQGIKFIHSQGFIHRDLKPQNIFLNDQKIVIGDFGFSCQSSMKTMRKTMVGTMSK
jgi:serine/threonine protein kinase